CDHAPAIKLTNVTEHENFVSFEVKLPGGMMRTLKLGRSYVWDEHEEGSTNIVLELPDEMASFLTKEANRLKAPIFRVLNESVAAAAISLREELRRLRLFRYADGSAWSIDGRAATWEDAQREYERQVQAG